MADTERNIIIDIQTNTNKALGDIKRLNKEIDRLNKQQAAFKKTSTQVNQMTRSFASLATHLGRLAVIYGAFQGLQNTVRTFAEFEASLKRLEVISGATEGEIAKLEERAKALGESTIYSASQVVEGMNAMAMAGLNAEQQLAGIGSVLDLATIGMIDLNEASLIAVRTMSSFGMQATDMGMIVDVMATAATDSAQTVTELGNAFEKVGSVATAYNVSLNETTAALEVMADAGRVGSEAGTQLKIVMSRLAGNPEAKKYLDQLGVSMYDANQKLIPFREQLELLRQKLGQLDDATRNEIAARIFGEEGKASALILLNYLDKYDAKLKKLDGSFGAARQKAQEMQDTLTGAYKELLSALEGLAIKIGEELTPVLRQLIEDSAKFIQNLDPAEVKAFGQSVAELLRAIGNFARYAVDVTEMLAAMAGGFKELSGVSAAWVIGLGALIIKLKGTLKAMLAFSVAHPIFAAITAALIALDAVIIEIQRDLKNFTTEVERSAEVLGRSAEAVEAFNDNYGKWDLAQTNAELNNHTKLIKDLEYSISSTERQVDSYLDRFLWLSDAEKQYVMDLKARIAYMKNSVQSHELAIDVLKQHGKVLTEQRRNEIRLINETRSAQNQLSMEAQYVTGEQQKALNKEIAAMESRKATLENTLGTMMGKERKYVADIAKLEAEKAEIRRKYANERESLELSLESRIANVSMRGLDDLQKYNAAQIRADEVLAQAKEALAKGNVEMAKRYMDEYNNLIEISAGEEIKVDDRVAKTKGTTKAEFIRDAQAGHKVLMEIIAQEEAAELAANQAKIDAKKADLELMKVQISLQKQMIEILAMMLEKANGIKFQPDFTEFEKGMRSVDSQLDALAAQQRQIKITAEVDGVEKEVKDAAESVTDVQATVDVDADTRQAYIQMTGFIKESEGSDVLVPVNLDTTIAKKEHEALKVEVTEKVYKPLSADAREALRVDRDLVQQLIRPVTKTIYLNYVPTGAYGAYQTGGMIQHLPLPRFADGGNLDSGVGHRRRAGALAGYGGGDKIKALLEAGEFIVRKEAVKRLGLARMMEINRGNLPRFQSGGMVDPVQRFASGGIATTSKTAQLSTMELNLNIGGRTFKMMTDEEVANSLATFIKRSEF